MKTIALFEMRKAFTCATAACALAIALAAPARPANAPLDAAFIGQWTQAKTPAKCSPIDGFMLKADGTARVGWVNPVSTSNTRAGDLERRNGTWTSAEGKLHLSMPMYVRITDVASGNIDTISSEITFDGSLDDGGNQLVGIVSNTRDHNIDGQPYEFLCAYVRA